MTVADRSSSINSEDFPAHLREPSSCDKASRRSRLGCRHAMRLADIMDMDIASQLNVSNLSWNSDEGLKTPRENEGDKRDNRSS